MGKTYDIVTFLIFCTQNIGKGKSEEKEGKMAMYWVTDCVVGGALCSMDG